MSESEFQPRIVGLETEYAWRFTAPGGVKDGVSDDLREELHTVLPQDVIRHAGTNSFRINLENGALYYFDMGKKWEYATPECGSFQEAVVYDMAGESYISQHLASAQEEGFIIRQLLNKRLSDHQIATNISGAHENYCLSPSDRIWPTEEWLARTELVTTHLVTRAIFTGAGSVDHDGVFHKTQKLRNSTENVNYGTTTNKPVFNTRDESHAGHDYKRLHVISGDANISPWATWMKLGTTSIVLRMIEHGMYPPNLQLSDVLKGAIFVGRTSSIDTPLNLINGVKLTALEIQCALVECARRLDEASPLPHEEREVLDEWEKVLIDLKKDKDLCGDRVDWINREKYIQERADSKERAKALDIGYDLMLPVRGLGFILRDTGGFKNVPSPEQVDVARTRPPQSTRAAVRGKAVRLMASWGLNGLINWDRIKCETLYGEYSLDLSDPTKHDSEEFDVWFEQIVKHPYEA